MGGRRQLVRAVSVSRCHNGQIIGTTVTVMAVAMSQVQAARGQAGVGEVAAKGGGRSWWWRWPQPLLSINNQESLPVRISDEESLFLNLNTEESLLMNIDSAESLLVNHDKNPCL